VVAAGKTLRFVGASSIPIPLVNGTTAETNLVNTGTMALRRSPSVSPRPIMITNNATLVVTGNVAVLGTFTTSAQGSTVLPRASSLVADRLVTAGRLELRDVDTAEAPRVRANESVTFASPPTASLDVSFRLPPAWFAPWLGIQGPRTGTFLTTNRPVTYGAASVLVQ
jgi:hypothetical protein